MEINSKIKNTEICSPLVSLLGLISETGFYAATALATGSMTLQQDSSKGGNT